MHCLHCVSKWPWVTWHGTCCLPTGVQVAWEIHGGYKKTCANFGLSFSSSPAIEARKSRIYCDCTDSRNLVSQILASICKKMPLEYLDRNSAVMSLVSGAGAAELRGTARSPGLFGLSASSTMCYFRTSHFLKFALLAGTARALVARLSACLYWARQAGAIE